MMKQKLVAGAALLSAIAGFSVPAVHAEAVVAASVGASNMYYWRGFDLGGGAALSADLNVSANGFIAGIWTSSGDSAADDLGGTEYDLYAGYSGAAGDFTYGVSVVSYNYPTLGELSVEPGDYVEVIPTLGYGPFKVTYYDAVAADHYPLGSKEYSYLTAELNFEKFGFKYGVHGDADGSAIDSVSHLDATYKYNSKLSFTIGKIIDNNDDAFDDKVNFIVNLSLPIE
ncbi:MAG: TorF family putative porin [Pseudomonadota bacterium]